MIAGAGAVLVIVLVIVVATVTTSDRRNKETQWKNISPDVQLDATYVQISGTWNDQLVVTGMDDENESGVIESFNLDEKGQWNLQARILTMGIVESLAVSKVGSRVAVAVMEPLRFIVYDQKDGTWNQYGDVIDARDLVSDGDMQSPNKPNVMLSSDGRTLAISFQPGASETLDGYIHVLQDVNSLGGNIGGVWKRRGTAIQNLHDQEHGDFATYTAMDGDGLKVAVASEHEAMSVYEWTNDEQWLLTAEYNESPLPVYGSLSLSRDGSTMAVGSYEGKLEGTGELHIVNDVWAWSRYNEDGSLDLDGTIIQVSLSAKGDCVLAGHYPLESGTSSLQVYQFNAIRNKWTSRGRPFGQTSSSQVGSVDISDDGNRVAAIINGKVFVYEYTGEPLQQDHKN